MLVLWPEATSTGAYKLFGGVNGRLHEGSHQWVLPRTSAASVLAPMGSHNHTTSAGDCPTLSGISGSVSYGVTASSPWVLHKTLCVSSKSGVSVSPSPVEVLQSNPTGLQSLII